MTSCKFEDFFDPLFYLEKNKSGYKLIQGLCLVGDWCKFWYVEATGSGTVIIPLQAKRVGR